MNAVPKEVIGHAEDIGAIEHKHEVGPELREVAVPAVVEVEPEEHVPDAAGGAMLAQT